MNRSAKIFSIFLFSLVVCSSVFAVEAPKRTNDKYAGVLAGPAPKSTSTVANPPAAQGNRVNQGTATPDRPVCSAFQEYKNEPSELQAQNRPGGKTMCPPGYRCNASWQGNTCLYRCVSDHRTQLFGDDPACKWDDCGAACNRASSGNPLFGG